MLEDEVIRRNVQQPIERPLADLAKSIVHSGEKMSDRKRQQMQDNLYKSLNEGKWSLRGGVASLDAYMAYYRSDYHVLPYSGGYLDQPTSIIEDFRTIRNVLDFHILNEQWD